VSETWSSGVECPLGSLKGTPAGDRYTYYSLGYNVVYPAAKHRVKNSMNFGRLL